MHQKGLGLPKDFHLAKRYYDLAIEINKEAYVPAMLALASLAVEYGIDYLAGTFTTPAPLPPLRQVWSRSCTLLVKFRGITKHLDFMEHRNCLFFWSFYVKYRIGVVCSILSTPFPSPEKVSLSHYSSYTNLQFFYRCVMMP